MVSSKSKLAKRRLFKINVYIEFDLGSAERRK
jgi:hypothetical protein